ncbi:MAG: SWIM zinc finger family protein [Pseudomonadota bacterium]
MSLTTETITALAPDQASLKAANKLMKASKWPSLSKGETLVWGECQGSGANPYRTVFDATDHGYKCTCPSRKFPCKHVLALMWMYVEDPSPFSDNKVPDWVTDWLGRRRKTGPATKADSTERKSLVAARLAEPEKPVDPKVEARRKAAAEKRAQATQKSLLQAVQDLEQWLNDQVTTGLSAFLDDAGERCRTIAARLVDSKAQALASRLDELPARLMHLRGEARLDAVIQEFGRMVLICRAYAAAPEDPELRRIVTTSETREALLDLKDVPRKAGAWEVVGEQVATRRDGLVSQSTWLLLLDHEPATFALLLDFYPASLGKRTSAFSVGERFQAEIAYYPARQPMRAVLADRSGDVPGPLPWPEPATDPMQNYSAALQKAPWTSRLPLLLPPGRIGFDGKEPWWLADERATTLPLDTAPPDHLAGSALNRTVGLWDGTTFALLAAQTEWGSLSFNG